MMAAAFVGAIVSGPLADIMGRRGLAMACTILSILGDLLLVSAYELSMFYAGRAITGVSVGMLSMVLPLYLTEVAPLSLRGRAIAFHQFCIILGISIAFWVTYGSYYLYEDKAWRVPLGVQLIPTLIFGVALFLVPQSPRYLVQKHRDEEALKVLSMIRGDGTIEHSAVQMEFAEIKQTLMFEEKHEKIGYRSLFHRGKDKNPQRLLLGIFAQAFQQLTGANTLMLFAPLIFHATGITTGRVPTLFANGISGVVMVVATIPAMLLIDRWSRRKTMIIGALGCGVSLLVMSIIAGTSQYEYDGLEHYFSDAAAHSEYDSSTSMGCPTPRSVIFFAMFYIFLAFYGCTWGPLGWIYPAELYSQGVRSKALGITTASNWFFTFGVIQIAPLAFEQIQWKVYVIYCVFCFTIAAIVYRYFPETRGKSLEEMDLLFSGNFKSFDPAVHHPTTASEALAYIEQKNSKYNNQLSFMDVTTSTE
ncbi:sugar transporter [Phascolomyces articulosus]|uniref:Sugar transporter n=1 Tax=Phascolomyces articulosus TaxID=60185 RepID=A0AAD5KB45_9FUNG|nr:sugar transporter [Phascolomyces articulosus]